MITLLKHAFSQSPRTLRGLAAGCVLLIGAQAVGASEAPGLFGQLDRARAAGVMAELAAVRTRAVTINLGVLLGSDMQDQIELNLFDDVSYVGLVDQLQATQSQGVVLGGTLEGVAGGSFLIVSNPGAIDGYVRVPGEGLYQFRGSEQGLGLVELLTPRAFENCDGAMTVPGNGPRGTGGLSLEPRSISPAGSVDDGSEIDVMVLYTNVARASAGGTNAIEARVDLAIAATNRSYANSEINFRVNLVHAEEVEYDEVRGQYSDHLRALTWTTDGTMDQIHALRNEHGADMVSMLVNDRRSCGNAWLMQTASPGFESSAFSVTTWTCAAGNLSFPHELGHNMGACHAVGDPCSSGLFSYSHGYKFTGEFGRQWRTVMAYSPGERVEQFSNPDVVYDGVPAGISLGMPGETHNALTFNQSAITVANFRASIPGCVSDFFEDGVLNFFDVAIFLSSYNNQDASADLTSDEVWNFFDIAVFLTGFAAGCP